MTDPHADQPVETGGTALAAADAAMVMLHGRGASARSVLQLGEQLDVEGVAFLAPQAARNTWYPNRFIAPIEDNEPHLTGALEVVDETVQRALDAGLDHDHVVVLGFSQGACLATEYAARNPRRYGGVVALSGGLIGPPGSDLSHDGDMDGTPVFLGCSDSDPHIPDGRVHETAAVFEAMNADVDERIYPGMGHTIIADEIDAVRDIVTDLT